MRFAYLGFIVLINLTLYTDLFPLSKLPKFAFTERKQFYEINTTIYFLFPAHKVTECAFKTFFHTGFACFAFKPKQGSL